MLDKNNGVWVEMHEDAWWMKVLDDALSPEEEAAWKAHLQVCARCRAEWGALAQVDMLLSVAPVAPLLPEAFTEETVSKILSAQRRRRWWAYLAGTLVVVLVGAGAYLFMGSALASVERGLAAVLGSRQMLFWSLLRVAVSLVTAWGSVLPYLLAMMAVGLLLVMPNGLLATFAVFWLSRHRHMARPDQLEAQTVEVLA